MYYHIKSSSLHFNSNQERSYKSVNTRKVTTTMAENVQQATYFRDKYDNKLTKISKFAITKQD